MDQRNQIDQIGLIKPPSLLIDKIKKVSGVVWDPRAVLTPQPSIVGSSKDKIYQQRISLDEVFPFGIIWSSDLFSELLKYHLTFRDSLSLIVVP